MSSYTTLTLSAVILHIPGLLNGATTGGLDGIAFASGAPCVPSATGEVETVDVNADSVLNLASYLDCENGEFKVNWRGSVVVNETIRIGAGTKVSVFGNHDNGLLTNNYAQQLVNSGYDGNTTILTIEAESEGSEVIAGSPFGSLFFVESGTLNLENMALRDSYATNVILSGITSGGGVTALQSNLTVTGCQFEDIFTDYRGGGINGNQSQIVVWDSLFRRCAAGLESIPGDEEVDVQGAGGGFAVRYFRLHACLLRVGL